MQRVALIVLLLVLALALANCGHGSSSTTGPPANLAIVPNPVSLNFGQTAQLLVSITDANGTTVTGQTITFTSDNTSLATVSTGGLVCAGTWDSTTTPTVCTPPSGPGTATITATVASLTTKIPVFVHANVDRISIQGSVDLANCISAGSTGTLSARAFSRGVDITSSVGVFSWTTNANIPGVTTQPTVASIDTSGKCSTDNTCVLTAVTPGQTSVYATAGNLTSEPGTFTTCPVKSISLHKSGATDTSVTLSTGGTQALAVDIVDSKGTTLTSVAPQFNWSQPAGISIAGSTITAIAASASTTIASCSPTFNGVAQSSASNFCNVNLYPVYSNPFRTTVSGSTSSTVYVASTNDTSLVPIDTTANTAGTALTLPYKPNSMMFLPNGTGILLGSDSAIIGVTIANSTISSNTSLNGKVLAISPDSSTAIVANASTVYVYTIASGAFATFPLAGVTAAAWSPDGYEAYIVAGNTLSVFTPGAFLHTFNIGAVRDVDFLSQGSFAYLAGGPSPISVYATCNNAQKDGLGSGAPSLIRSLPDASHVLAVNGGNLDDVTVALPAPPDTGSTTPNTSTATCNAPAVTNTLKSSSFNVGSITASKLIVTPDSTKAFITAANQGGVLSYDVASQTPGFIPVSGASGTFSGGTTLDSAFLYVGVGGTNTVARIDTKAGTVATTIPVTFSTCPSGTTCVPDLVAVRPK